MADNPNSIGDIVVTITGDAAPLQDFLNLAENLAQEYGPKIADGIGKGSDGADKTRIALGALVDTFPDLKGASDSLTASTDGAASSMLKVGSAAQDVLAKQASLEANVRSAQSAYDDLRRGFDNGTVSAATLARAQDELASAITKANPQLAGMTPAIDSATQAAGSGIPSFQDLAKAALGFVGIELGAKALLDFAKDAIESYAAVERATISIDALTGSAGRATGIITELKGLAIQDALSFPSLVTAEQRMLAFGVNSAKIPIGLQLIADTAAALGRNFDQMSDRFDRVIESGNISARTLVLLGLNMRDVAAAMGVTEGAASAAFKALDQSGRVDILAIALQKFSGTAEAVAQSLSGQWQNLKTQADFTFQGIGQLLAPLASEFLSFGTSILQGIQIITGSFTDVAKSGNLLIDEISAVGTAVLGSGEKTKQAGKQAEESSDNWFSLLSGLTAVKDTFNLVTISIEAATNIVPHLGATVEELTAKATKGATAGLAFQNAWNLSELQSGIIPATAAMDALLKQQDEAKNKYEASTIALNAFTQSMDTQTADTKGHIATQDDVNRAYAAQQTALKALDVTASGHIQTADQLEHKEADLQDAVEKARKSFSDEQSKIEAGVGSVGALKAAKEQLTAATKAAHQATADHVLSLGDLISKNAELNSALATAQSVYDQVTARVKAGSGEYNLQSEALKQLIKVHKDLGDAETNVHLIMEITKEKVADLIDKILAQGQAVDNLTSEYGPHALVVDTATKAYDSLLKQTGLTATQIHQLTIESDRTGTSLMDLVNQSAITAGAFKALGETSSAQFRDMADKANVAYLTIAATASSSMGDVYAAMDKVRQANLNVRDSTTGLARAFQDAGIHSSQAIGDAAAKIDAAFKFIASSGNAAYADLVRASDAARNADFAYQQSLSVTTDAFRNLGITSSAQLQHIADENKIMYERIRNDAMSSGGDIDRAWQTWQKSVDKYHESLLPLPDAHKAIGSSAKDAFQTVTDSIYTAITAVQILTDNLVKQEAQYQKAAAASFADQYKNVQIGSVGLNFSGSPDEIMAQRDRILSGSPGQSIPVGSPGEKALTQIVDAAALIAAGAAAGGFSGTGKFAGTSPPSGSTAAAASVAPDIAAMGVYIAAQQAAENTVKNLTLVVQDLTAKQDGSATMSRALTAAQADLQKALQATGQTTTVAVTAADTYIATQQAAQQRVTTLTQAVADLTAKQDGSTLMTLALKAAEDDLAKATAAVTIPVQKVAVAFDAIASASDYVKTTVDALTKTQTDAQQKVQMLAQAVQQLTDKQDGSLTMQAALTQAQNDLNAALAAWKPLLYDLTTAEGQQASATQYATDLANKYVIAQQQAQQQVTQLTTVVDLLTQAQDGTKAMSNALADAQKQLAAAEKEAGVSAKDLAIATMSFDDQVQAEIDKLTNASTAQQDHVKLLEAVTTRLQGMIASGDTSVTTLQAFTAAQKELKQYTDQSTVATKELAGGLKSIGTTLNFSTAPLVPIPTIQIVGSGDKTTPTTTTPSPTSPAAPAETPLQYFGPNGKIDFKDLSSIFGSTGSTNIPSDLSAAQGAIAAASTEALSQVKTDQAALAALQAQSTDLSLQGKQSIADLTDVINKDQSLITELKQQTQDVASASAENIKAATAVLTKDQATLADIKTQSAAASVEASGKVKDAQSTLTLAQQQLATMLTASPKTIDALSSQLTIDQAAVNKFQTKYDAIIDKTTFTAEVVNQQLQDAAEQLAADNTKMGLLKGATPEAKSALQDDIDFDKAAVKVRQKHAASEQQEWTDKMNAAAAQIAEDQTGLASIKANAADIAAQAAKHIQELQNMMANDKDMLTQLKADINQSALKLTAAVDDAKNKLTQDKALAPVGTTAAASQFLATSSTAQGGSVASSQALAPDISMLQAAVKLATNEQLAHLPDEIASIIIEAMSVSNTSPRSTIDKVISDIQTAGGALKISSALAPPIVPGTMSPNVSPTTAAGNSPVTGAAASGNVGTTIYMYNTVSTDSQADSLVQSVQRLGTATGKV